MSVKILGGIAKGFNLYVPTDQTHLRPTSVMLKRKIFDWKQNWEDDCFIDLCAGSGSMGLEALSRGAMRVDLIEKNKVSTEILRKNTQKLCEHYPDFQDKLNVYQNGFEHYLKSESFSKNLDNTIFFFDPPYENHKSYQSFLELMHAIQLPLNVWIESDEKKGVSSLNLKKSFSLIKKELYHGDHFILIGQLK